MHWKCLGSNRNRMKFLLQNYNIVIRIRWIAMMFKIFLYHLICYISCTPYSISYRPKMPTPISFTKLWKFFLKASGCATLQPFNYITNILRRTIFYMDMHVVFTYYTFKYSNIFNIAYLLYQIPTSYLNVTIKDFITILRYPNNMGGKYRNRMSFSPLFFYKTKLINCVATESLALKVHSFN